MKHFNPFLASGNFCHLFKWFGPRLGPFDNLIAFLKEVFEKVILKKSADDNKIMKNYPSYKELKKYSSEASLATIVIRTIFRCCAQLSFVL